MTTSSWRGTLGLAATLVGALLVAASVAGIVLAAALSGP